MLLVTGITGLTGRFLYEELKKNEQLQVQYFVRPTSDISWMDSDEIFFFGDLANIDDVKKSLQGVETVLHLASIYHSGVITDACLSVGVKRVYYVNTTGMFSKYKAYSTLYKEFEAAIKASAIIYTIIRPTMIYGNRQDANIHKLIKLMKRFPVFPVLGDGRGLLHPIYAGDLAKVLASALQKEEITRYKAYNVAGKAPMHYMEILQAIRAALNRNVIFVHIPYQLALLCGRLGDFIPNDLINYEKVQRLKEDKNFDYMDAVKDLGFQPRSFYEGVALEVEALREAGLI